MPGSPLIYKSNGLQVSLARTYGPHQEVIQAACLTLKVRVLTIASLELEGMPDVTPDDHLHELREYHRRV